MGMICELFAVPAEAAQEVLRNPPGIHNLLESLQRSDSGLSLEKSWHGLHFVLTGTDWGGDPPLNFIARGGTPVGRVDVGYGPARVLGPSEVVKLNTALSAISAEEFTRRFDPVRLAGVEIYPPIWDEPVEDLRQEYGGYFQDLKHHVHRAAQNGQALIITVR
jgi:hypothetical protein